MTREQALAASHAIDAVDGFEAFMDEVDQLVVTAEDFCQLSPDFKLELQNLSQAELLRLKSELEVL